MFSNIILPLSVFSTIPFWILIVFAIIIFAIIVIKIDSLPILSALTGIILLVYIIGFSTGINNVIPISRSYDSQINKGVEYTTVSQYKDGNSFVFVISSGKKRRNTTHYLRVIRVKRIPPSNYFMLNGNGVPIALLPKK